MFAVPTQAQQWYPRLGIQGREPLNDIDIVVPTPLAPTKVSMFDGVHVFVALYLDDSEAEATTLHVERRQRFLTGAGLKVSFEPIGPWRRALDSRSDLALTMATSCGCRQSAMPTPSPAPAPPSQPGGTSPHNRAGGGHPES
jgi:hypothetical protein